MYYNWKKTTNTDELKVICNLIKNGELIIFPTETVYGIGANALDSKAVGKIFLAKGRASDNPLIVHIANKDSIDKIAEDITDVENKLIDTFMPGPFTIILKKRKDVIPDNVTCGLDTVAVRMPRNIIAKTIITFSGVPIAAPSANISGKPSGTNIEDIRKELESKVSAIIDGGDSEIGLESTVVKVIDEVPVVLRPGKITPEQIREVIGDVRIDNNVFGKIKNDEKVESPGMKYKHYAPVTKCELIYGEDERDLVFEISKRVRKFEGNIVVIGFKEHRKDIRISEERFLGIASNNNLEDYGKNIFSALRKADKIGANLIVIEGVKKEGLGIAIMNRLLRTCDYNYFECST
ncbi:MAG: threonylcarbamoyl-AMP synthase [Clostridia bacterium]|nr:threonylcarbamoyl-AMP synthase [Clostridia bacterium]